MPEGTMDQESNEDIEQLLSQRQQLASWLAKLADVSDGLPAKARDRVRADYEGRLAEVVFQLRSHTTALTGSLDALKVEHREAEQAAAEEEESLAEAQLRHRVGEYDDATWERRSESARSRLDELGQEIGRLAHEVERLEDVLGQITEEAAEPVDDMTRPVSVMQAAEEAEEAEPAKDPVLWEEVKGDEDEERPQIETGTELTIDLEAESQAMQPEPVEAPRFIPKGRDSGPARAIRFPTSAPSAPAQDELAFLKSIEGGRTTAGSATESKEARPAERAGTAAKTLKCGDCGAMNRPTEWYCERCGAELAAL